MILNLHYLHPLTQLKRVAESETDFSAVSDAVQKSLLHENGNEQTDSVPDAGDKEQKNDEFNGDDAKRGVVLAVQS